ncbi:histidine phosphatase family protein [Chloroflexota bacterium]
MDLILARHGETKMNLEEIFRGRMDISLNETGLKQAELLSGFLEETKIKAVLSSPLKRALQTAEAIASNHGLEIEITPELNDLDFGEWQGLPLVEVRTGYVDLFREWTDSPEKVVLPGGESLDDVTKRAMKVVDRVVGEYDGTVVLVSHRVVNKIIILALLGLDNSHFWNIRQDTCGITTFSYNNGRFVLTAHNITSFLDSLRVEKLADF